MNNRYGQTEKGKLISFKKIGKMFGIITASFLLVFAVIVGVMYLAGSFKKEIIKPEGAVMEVVDTTVKTSSNGIEYYVPSLVSKNEQGEITIANSFFVIPNATNEDVTETECVVTTSDRSIVYFKDANGKTVDSISAELGKNLEVFVAKDSLTKMPNGGVATITVRIGTLYTKSINVFIDVPVNKVTVNATKQSGEANVVYVNETISLNTPKYFPTVSQNPTTYRLASSSNALITRNDKKFAYKVEFLVKNLGEDIWVDIDTTESAYVASKVVKWSNGNLVAVKTGKFRITAYTFSTYNYQDEFYDDNEILANIDIANCDIISESVVYDIVEVGYKSFTTSKYANQDLKVNFKDTIKLYLNSAKSDDELKRLNAINLGLRINPQDNYGVSYTDLLGYLRNVYVDYNPQESPITFKSDDAVVDDKYGFILYPTQDLNTEYNAFKEYYYEIAITTIANDYNLKFYINDPNSSQRLETTIKINVSEVTSIIGFENSSNYQGGIEFSNNDGYVLNVEMNSMTDRYNEKISEINLFDFVYNRTASGERPTYDMIKLYAFVSNSKDNAMELENLRRVLLIENTAGYSNDAELIISAQTDVYALELPNGILKPTSYGVVGIYAVLVRTDYNGNIIYDTTTGKEIITYAYQVMTVNISVIPTSVQINFYNSQDEEVDYDKLKEGYYYKLMVTPIVNNVEADPQLLDTYIKEGRIRLDFVDVFNLKTPQLIINDELRYYQNEGLCYATVYCPNNKSGQYSNQLYVRAFFKQDATNEISLIDGDQIDVFVQETRVTSISILGSETYIYNANWNGERVEWNLEEYTGDEDINNKKIAGKDFLLNFLINGENKNVDIQTIASASNVNINAVKVEKSEVDGNYYVKFLGPSNGYITIKVISTDVNSDAYDEIKIWLKTPQIVFEPVDTITKEIVDGVIYEKGTDKAYTITAYKDQSYNIFDIINAKIANTNISCNGLLTFEMQQSTEYAKLVNSLTEPDENAIIKPIIKFIKNGTSNITVVVKSQFGESMQVTFSLNNYVDISLKSMTEIQNAGNSISIYRRSASEEYKEYPTFVLYSNKTINCSSLLNMQAKSTTRIEDINLKYNLINARAYPFISFTSAGVLSTSASTSRYMQNSTLITIEVIEEVSENESLQLCTFDMLLVPNIAVETCPGITCDIVYKAGVYKFTQNNENKIIDLNENAVDNQVSVDLLQNAFDLKDFYGKQLDVSGGIGYNSVSVLGCQLLKKGDSLLLVVDRTKIFTNTIVEVQINITIKGFVYSGIAIIELKPYYSIEINESENKEYTIQDGVIDVYVDYATSLSRILTVKHDDISASANMTFTLATNPYLTLTEGSNAGMGQISAREYSKGNILNIKVFIGGIYTGYDLKVRVVHNFDINSYRINDGYYAYSSDINYENVSEAGNYTIKSCISKVDIYEIVNGKKLSNKNENAPFCNPIITDLSGNISKYAYYDEINRQICFNSCATRQFIIVKLCPQGINGLELQDVEPYNVVIAIEPSEELTITYKYDTNNITDLNALLYYGLDVEKIVGAKGYFELTYDDEIVLSNVITATNRISNDMVEDIFDELNIIGQVFNTSIGDWQNSNWLTNFIRNGKLIVGRDYNAQTYARLVITSPGGLLGYVNLLLQTDTTINSTSRVVVSLIYPSNFSRYEDDNQKYEIVNVGDNESLNIKLTTIDTSSNQNILRISARHGSTDVTSSLVLGYKVYENITSQIPVQNISGIYLQNGILTIQNSVPSGTVIRINMHNAYTDFNDVYNIYVGGNVLVDFFNDLVNENGVQYRKKVTYNPTDLIRNKIYLSELFSIKNLSGQPISADRITYELDNNKINDDIIASLTDKGYINIDNYAPENGKVVTLRIIIDKDSESEFECEYKLLVCPAIVNFKNENASINSQINPQEVIGDAGKTLTLVNNSGKDLIDLTNLLSSNNENATYSLMDLSLIAYKTGDSNKINYSDISIIKNTNLLQVNVNKEILSEVLVTIEVTTPWGRTKEYYICLKPTKFAEINNQHIQVYANTDYNLFDTTNYLFKIYKYNEDNPVEITYNSSEFRIEAYINGVDIGSLANVATINHETGIMTFYTISENLNCIIKLYRIKSSTEKVLLAEATIEICPNFNSADIIVTNNSNQNSIDNPIIIGQDGFDLCNYVNINRFIDDNISKYFDPERKDGKLISFNKAKLLEKLGYESENNILNFNSINNKILITVNSSYVNSSDNVITLKLYDGLNNLIKVIYVKVPANYSFRAQTSSKEIYVGVPLDLSFLGDAFVDANGTRIVGGKVSFAKIDSSDYDFDFIKDSDNNDTNILKVANGLKEEKSVKLLVKYEVNGLTYLGITEVTLKPKYSINTVNTSIHCVKDYDITKNTDNLISKLTFSDVEIDSLDFINTNIECYESNRKVDISEINTNENKIIKLYFVSEDIEKGICIVKARLEEDGNFAETEIYICKSNSKQNNEYEFVQGEYNQNIIGGDNVNLNQFLIGGGFYFSNGEEIVPETINGVKYVFVSADGSVINNSYLQTKITTQNVEKSVLVSITSSEVKYYGLIKFEVLSSVTVGVNYTNPSQNISSFKAGQSFYLKDLIYFKSPKGNANRYVDGGNITYTISFFQDTADGVTKVDEDDIDDYYTITDYNKNDIYGSINPKIHFKLSSNNCICVIQATLTLLNDDNFTTSDEEDGIITDYFYVKIEGIEYEFIQNDKIKIYSEGDEIKIEDIGYFTNINIATYSYKSMSDFYAIRDGKIVSFRNINGETTCDIMVKAMLEDGTSYYGVGKIMLNETYKIGNKINGISGEKVTSGEMSVTLTENLLSTKKYLVLQDNRKKPTEDWSIYNFIKYVSISLYDATAVHRYSQIYDWSYITAQDWGNGSDWLKNDYYNLTLGKNNNEVNLYLENNDEMVGIRWYYTILITFESFTQNVNVSYSIYVTNDQLFYTLSSDNESEAGASIELKPNGTFNLSNISIYKGSLKLESGYTFNYSVPENYLMYDEPEKIIMAKPYFTRKEEFISVTIYHGTEWIGYLNISVIINPIETYENDQPTKLENVATLKNYNTDSLTSEENICYMFQNIDTVKHTIDFNVEIYNDKGLKLNNVLDDGKKKYFDYTLIYDSNHIVSGCQITKLEKIYLTKYFINITANVAVYYDNDKISDTFTYLFQLYIEPQIIEFEFEYYTNDNDNLKLSKNEKVDVYNLSNQHEIRFDKGTYYSSIKLKSSTNGNDAKYEAYKIDLSTYNSLYGISMSIDSNKKVGTITIGQVYTNGVLSIKVIYKNDSLIDGEFAFYINLIFPNNIDSYLVNMEPRQTQFIDVGSEIDVKTSDLNDFVVVVDGQIIKNDEKQQLKNYFTFVENSTKIKPITNNIVIAVCYNSDLTFSDVENLKSWAIYKVKSGYDYEFELQGNAEGRVINAVCGFNYFYNIALKINGTSIENNRFMLKIEKIEGVECDPSSIIQIPENSNSLIIGLAYLVLNAEGTYSLLENNYFDKYIGKYIITITLSYQNVDLSQQFVVNILPFNNEDEVIPTDSTIEYQFDRICEEANIYDFGKFESFIKKYDENNEINNISFTDSSEDCVVSLKSDNKRYLYAKCVYNEIDDSETTIKKNGLLTVNFNDYQTYVMIEFATSSNEIFANIILKLQINKHSITIRPNTSENTYFQDIANFNITQNNKTATHLFISDTKTDKNEENGKISLSLGYKENGSVISLEQKEFTFSCNDTLKNVKRVNLWDVYNYSELYSGELVDDKTLFTSEYALSNLTAYSKYVYIGMTITFSGRTGNIGSLGDNIECVFNVLIKIGEMKVSPIKITEKDISINTTFFKHSIDNGTRKVIVIKNIGETQLPYQTLSNPTSSDEEIKDILRDLLKVGNDVEISYGKTNNIFTVTIEKLYTSITDEEVYIVDKCFVELSNYYEYKIYTKLDLKYENGNIQKCSIDLNDYISLTVDDSFSIFADGKDVLNGELEYVSYNNMQLTFKPSVFTRLVKLEILVHNDIEDKLYELNVVLNTDKAYTINNTNRSIVDAISEKIVEELNNLFMVKSADGSKTKQIQIGKSYNLSNLRNIIDDSFGVSIYMNEGLYSNNILTLSESEFSEQIYIRVSVSSAYSSDIYSYSVALRASLNDKKIIYNQTQTSEKIIYNQNSGNKLKISLSNIGSWYVDGNRTNTNVKFELIAGERDNTLFSITTGEDSSLYLIFNSAYENYVLLRDYNLKLKTSIALSDDEIYTQNISFTIKSEINFVGQIIEMSSYSFQSIILDENVAMDKLTFEILQNDTTDDTIKFYVGSSDENILFKGQFATTNPDEGTIKNFQIKITDLANNTKILACKVIVVGAKVKFTYQSPEKIKISVNESKYLTIQDIGSFIVQDGSVITRLNDLNNVSFKLYSQNPDVLKIKEDGVTIYAEHIFIDTFATLKVELVKTTLKEDGKEERETYYGYIEVIIISPYSVEKTFSSINYEIDPNVQINLSDLINFKKNGEIIQFSGNEYRDLISEYTYKRNVEIEGKNIDSDYLSFGHDDSGKVYSLIVSYTVEKNNEELPGKYVIHIIIKVNILTYVFEEKEDIYSLYSGQIIDLSKLMFEFFNANGLYINVDNSKNITYNDKKFNGNGYTINDKNELIASPTFKEVLTNVKIEYVEGNKKYIGYIQLNIKPTYELQMGNDISNAIIVSYDKPYNLINSYLGINSFDEVKYTFESGQNSVYVENNILYAKSLYKDVITYVDIQIENEQTKRYFIYVKSLATETNGNDYVLLAGETSEFDISIKDLYRDEVKTNSFVIKVVESEEFAYTYSSDEANNLYKFTVTPSHKVSNQLLPIKIKVYDANVYKENDDLNNIILYEHTIYVYIIQNRFISLKVRQNAVNNQFLTGISITNLINLTDAYGNHITDVDNNYFNDNFRVTINGNICQDCTNLTVETLVSTEIEVVIEDTKTKDKLTYVCLIII